MIFQFLSGHVNRRRDQGTVYFLQLAPWVTKHCKSLTMRFSLRSICRCVTLYFWPKQVCLCWSTGEGRDLKASDFDVRSPLQVLSPPTLPSWTWLSSFPHDQWSGHFQYGPEGFDLWSHLFEPTERCRHSFWVWLLRLIQWWWWSGQVASELAA